MTYIHSITTRPCHGWRLRPARHRRGIVYLAALVLLTLFASLAVAFAAFSDMNFQKSDNHRWTTEAHMAAESGLSYMRQQIKDIRLPGNTDESTFAANFAPELSNRLNGTANMGGLTVSSSGSKVNVPLIRCGQQSFVSSFSWAGPNLVRMDITGTARDAVSRRVGMNLAMELKRSAAFDYGLASRGRISISGSSRIVGVNYMSEASVLSTTLQSGEAVAVGGSAIVSGDLSTTGNPASISITGSPTIAGSTDPAVIAQHCHFGVEAPQFPQYDVTPLAALATNVVTKSTNTSGSDMVFENIRIAANTNPVFSSNVTINGIVYVEAPNTVKFEGKATVNGLVVTQPSNQPIETCQLNFAGGVEAFSVETLPNLPQFAAVKQQTGTFVLAPGFGVTFAGHFSAINGTIAADQLTFTGTAEGQIKGSVIGLKDLPTNINGNVDIFVDRTNADPDPAGFIMPAALVPQPDTYREVAGG